MKKRLIANILLICLLLCQIPAIAEETLAFTDVAESDPAYVAIMDFASRQIISGKGEGTFCPDDFLKREELAKILVNAFSLTETKNASVFYDVPIGVWFDTYVQKLSASELVKGVSDTEFGVGHTVTRQDLAVILRRYLETKNVELTVDNVKIFADDSSIASYAREAVLQLSAAGIMKERQNNLWEPQAYVTRAETVLAVYNAYNFARDYIESLGKYGSVEQYDPPYNVPTDDRLAEAMPKPFDANVWPKSVIAFEDGEDDDFGVLVNSVAQAGTSRKTEGGYESDGCFVVEKKGIYRLTYVTEPGEFQPGDFLSLTAMVKGENVTSNGGYYTAILEIANEDNRWLNEAHSYQSKTSRDWREVSQILMVPEVANTLSTPRYYNININLYAGDLTGTIYFDDIRLSKLKFEPMDTVLMEPVYKGIIKGDNGVGDISLRAYVNELNGLYNLDEFKFISQITDEDHNVLLKTESDTVKSVMDVHYSSASLPMGGDYWLETIIVDKNTGEQIQKQEWGLHKREADFETVIGYDKYGRVTRNGVPYLPISIYNWSSYSGLSTDVIGQGAIDNLMHSGMSWYYSFGTSEYYRNLVSSLDENNQTISLATGNMAYSNMYVGEVVNRVKQQSDIRGLATKLVNNFKDLPNLFAYYIYDEQNAMRYGNEEAWVRQIIESEDLDHPTTCAIDNTISFRKGIYAKTSDFLGYDPYPVTGKVDQDISLVYDRISEAKRINPNRPVYTILQGFYFSTRSGDLRGPTKEEFRNMAFQALCAGSCMLDCYGYRAVMNTPSPGRTSAEEWADYNNVFLEIQHLEPIILSVEPAPYYEVKGGGDWLNTMARRYDGKSYLFTVNNDSLERAATIYLDGVTKIKGMYSKKEYKANKEGFFEIEWDGYGVEVFEYEQEDYKSPHAELKNFAVTNCAVADAESEKPCFILSNELKEVEYNAYISDYASLYINGEKVETTGKINLEGLSEIKVKVVSEDGRFTTEKTFLIKRS